MIIISAFQLFSSVLDIAMMQRVKAISALRYPMTTREIGSWNTEMISDYPLTLKHFTWIKSPVGGSMLGADKERKQRLQLKGKCQYILCNQVEFVQFQQSNMVRLGVSLSTSFKVSEVGNTLGWNWDEDPANWRGRYRQL